MSSPYRTIYPLAQKEDYSSNDAVDFTFSFEDEKLMPNSIFLSGEFEAKKGGAVLGVTERVYYDAQAGFHALLRSISTQFKNVGIVENIDNYPRMVAMKEWAGRFEGASGTETDSAVEGKLAHYEQSKGVMIGQTGTDVKIPFCIRLDVSANKVSAPISFRKAGDVRIRFRLSDDREFFFGEDVDSTVAYKLYKLRLHYQVMPDDGKDEPVQIEMSHGIMQQIISNNSNISTFVPGLSDAVHMSFIRADRQNTITDNYLACEPLKGKPPGSSVANQLYGAERLVFSLNEYDTALYGFTMESREEMAWNALRSYRNEPKEFKSSLGYSQDARYRNGYLLGTNFGSLMDFSQRKFACEVQSQADNTSAGKYNAYLFFRMLAQV